jgi:hypothetical protein
MDGRFANDIADSQFDSYECFNKALISIKAYIGSTFGCEGQVPVVAHRDTSVRSGNWSRPAIADLDQTRSCTAAGVSIEAAKHRQNPCPALPTSYKMAALGARLAMQQDQPPRVGRRLAAIVAADVAGYSRLMGLDEVGTARTLREHRKVTDALVEKHGGTSQIARRIRLF